MSTTQEPEEQDAPSASSTLPGTLNLLAGFDAPAGAYCSGGVCHVPAQKAP
ncbi:hypothetical protein [Microbacterium sp. NPDC089695]|uniref:hypothetical protein n=1 Tax=Microbacterium sp. NPDC089695 TaxID=3364198 RepID=UPI0038013C4C